MGWERPYWAGFAVAFCALSTTSQSLTKGAMRMLGTLVAAVVALVLISLFAQQRWLFMVGLSSWVALCTYMMAGDRFKYFWNVCGFVCAIICLDGGADSANDFQTAVLRIEETGLGLFVFSVVSIVLWPNNEAAPGATTRSPTKPARQGLHMDPTRLAAAGRVMVTIWVAYVLWIYVRVPGGMGVVALSVSLGMVLAVNPQVRVPMIAIPVAGSVAFAGTLYTLVMPHLSGYLQLGCLIFAAATGIAYLFSDPRQALSKAIAMAMFATIISVNNVQTYSFLTVANTAAMLAVLFTMLQVLSELPVLWRPVRTGGETP